MNIYHHERVFSACTRKHKKCRAREGWKALARVIGKGCTGGGVKIHLLPRSVWDPESPEHGTKLAINYMHFLRERFHSSNWLPKGVHNVK